MIIHSEEVKKISFRLGADLCGIAPVKRFEGAPQGFHPCDVLKECKSVIVLAKRFLTSTLHSKSTIPYTDVRNDLSRRMDEMAIDLSYELESRGVLAVPINAIGPTEWDESAKKTRGIISLKHAGELAGLGKIGKNTLLINDKYGNMIWLSAVVTSAKLEPDPIAEYEGCIPNCKICLHSCPVKALDGISMNQKACRDYAFGTHDGGEWRIKCFTCRRACPNVLGIRNLSLKNSNRGDFNEDT
ncbi:MAG: epoxyqueuosine reductase [Candidatus Odinarchaeota archaeon]